MGGYGRNGAAAIIGHADEAGSIRRDRKLCRRSPRHAENLSKREIKSAELRLRGTSVIAQGARGVETAHSTVETPTCRVPDGVRYRRLLCKQQQGADDDQAALHGCACRCGRRIHPVVHHCFGFTGTSLEAPGSYMSSAPGSVASMITATCRLATPCV